MFHTMLVKERSGIYPEDSMVFNCNLLFCLSLERLILSAVFELGHRVPSHHLHHLDITRFFSSGSVLDA